MNELLFPVAAVGATFLVVVPLLTLLSSAVLAQRRQKISSWVGFGSETTFAWLVAPTLLPSLWLMSSAVRQATPTQTAQSCFFDHINGTACFDTLLLLAFLVVGAVTTVAFRYWRERPRFALRELNNEHELTRRVRRIVEENAQLRGLRFIVVQGSLEPIYALGLLRPVVVIDACFVREVDVEILLAAILHEQAHVSGRDLLRNFFVRLCFAVNPASSLLKHEFEHWRNAREAACDVEAVDRGGEPLALAEGIVRAAKFHCAGVSSQGAALCGHVAATVNLRLALLLDGPPAPVRTAGHAVLVACIVIVSVAPYVEGLGLLANFHLTVERLLHPLT